MFSRFITDNKNRITFILFILLLAGIALMRYLDSFLITDVCPSGIVSFELAKESHLSAAMINSWDPQAKTAAGMSMGFDFLFLLIYASFLSMLIFTVNSRFSANFNSLYKWMIAVPFIAAFFDVIENIALVKLLLGDIQQRWSVVAYYSAMIKFGILFLVILYILIGGISGLKKRASL